MLVKSITEEEIYGIGHAFGYYDYGEETGMSAAFSGKEATETISALMCAGCCGAALPCKTAWTRKRSLIFSLGLSVCGRNIRGRAICERC